MNFMEEAYNESLKAYQQQDVPVGAVIVFNNEIIGKGFNNRINTNDVTAHAEVIAIKEAADKLGDWRLNDCDLYVTLKPCDMCVEIIKVSRISHVYYLIDKLDYKNKYDKTTFLKSDSFQQLELKYKEKLSDFFKTNTNR